MKVNYTTKNGRVSVELNGDTQREIFEQLSSFQEVFDETVCGKCGSDDVRFVVRNVDDCFQDGKTRTGTGCPTGAGLSTTPKQVRKNSVQVFITTKLYKDSRYMRIPANYGGVSFCLS
jgi:hypothetical protein